MSLKNKAHNSMLYLLYQYICLQFLAKCDRYLTFLSCENVNTYKSMDKKHEILIIQGNSIRQLINKPRF